MIEINKDQTAALSAIESFLTDDSLDAFILRGGAGTGKTTLIGKLVEIVERQGISFGLLAPTGRAARILGNKVSEITKRDIHGHTIHRCIYFRDKIEIYENASDVNDPGLRISFPLKTDEPTVKLLVIDEASMIGDKESLQDSLRFGSGQLLKDIITFCRTRRKGRETIDRLVKIIFIGDQAQLPPVGEKFSPALSAEYLASEYKFETSEFNLNLVMRQAEGNEILDRATEVRQSILTERFNNFSLRANSDDIREMKQEKALDLIEHDLKSKCPSIIIVRPNAAALEYNRSIRERLWGDPDLQIQVRDTLLINRNCPITGLRNGDLVKVLEVGPNPEIINVPIAGSGAVTLSFRSITVAYREYNGTVIKHECFILENPLQSPNREISPLEQRALLIHFRKRHPQLQVKSSEFKQTILSDPYFNALHVKYGYALTCHKAQGGEWDTVVVDFSHGGGVRNAEFFRWAYTAITRAAKKLVVIQPPEFNPIDSNMWGPEPTSQSNDVKSETQDLSADPDWQRFSFSTSIAPLFPFHQKLRAHWETKGIHINQLDHLQYCERYTVSRDEAHAMLQYFYNKHNDMGRFEILSRNGLDQVLASDAIIAFETLNTSDSSKKTDQFILDLLQRIDIAIDQSDIQRGNYRIMDYRLRVEFSDSLRKGSIDFIHDKKFTWTNAEEVGGPGKSNGLYDDIQSLMTSTGS